jgi:hypothetical protein
LLDVARERDVRFVAGNTTLGVMGVDPDDLIDGVERVGVDALLDGAAETDVQLFVWTRPPSRSSARVGRTRPSPSRPLSAASSGATAALVETFPTPTE